MSLELRNKSELRDFARGQRQDLLNSDQGLRSHASERVRLVLDDILKDVQGPVAGYRSQPFEVDLDPWLIAKPLNQLCFPRIDGESLSFYKVESWADFGINSQRKILEPIVKPQNQVRLEDIRVFLVPGLCFDRRGFRLGSGFGYYDRILQSSKALKIGIGFSKMVFTESLPVDTHDVPMDWVVTEDFVLQPLGQKGRGA